MKLNWKAVFFVSNFIVAYVCLLIKFAAAGIDPKFVRQEFDGVSVALYEFEGRPVWSEEEKNDIIFNHNKELFNVKFPTNAAALAIGDADFIPVAGRDAAISLTTTTFQTPLRVKAWYVPVLQKDGVIAFLSDNAKKDKVKAYNADMTGKTIPEEYRTIEVEPK